MNVSNKLHQCKEKYTRNSGKLQAIPGRAKTKKSVHTKQTSYQEFQESIKDAWDLTEDEFYTPENTQTFEELAKSAALKVISNHRYDIRNDCTSPSQHTSGFNTKNDFAIIRNLTVPEELLIPKSHSNRIYTCDVHRSPNHCSEQTQLLSNVKLVQTDIHYDIFRKEDKFLKLFKSPVVSLDDLKQLSWSGIPFKARPVAWRLLLGYLPLNLIRRQNVIERKRKDYWDLAQQYFYGETCESSESTQRQISIDIPRMKCVDDLCQQQVIQEMLGRILFIWAYRHPASGYVQGINDVLTPFFVVFLQEALPLGKVLDGLDVSGLSESRRNAIEADTFWCLTKFLDAFQDNYIFAQLGIQEKVSRLQELVQRVDKTLHIHLTLTGVDYLQFSYRWMNNLLIREMPLHCSLRLWDTFLAESDEMATFLMYVSAAFLIYWREQLLGIEEFQDLLLFLQNLPTENWTETEINLLVAEAYRLKCLFKDSPNHLG